MSRSASNDCNRVNHPLRSRHRDTEGEGSFAVPGDGGTSKPPRLRRRGYNTSGPKGRGVFPGRCLPAREKNLLLRVLCASAVKFARLALRGSRSAERGLLQREPGTAKISMKPLISPSPLERAAKGSTGKQEEYRSEGFTGIPPVSGPVTSNDWKGSIAGASLPRASSQATSPATSLTSPLK